MAERQQEGAAMAVPQARQQQQQPASVRFHLNPAASITGVLDFSDKESKKLYHAAVKPLYSQDERYDCNPQDMNGFLKAVHTRANEYGWDNEDTGILHIPEDHTDAQSDTNYLLREYGTISLERIKRFEKSYLGKETRAAQDSYMLYHCILKSLSKEARVQVQLWESEYITMNDDGTIVPSGNLLLKVVIRESHLDTNATTASIRNKLSNLDTYINTIGNDVLKFNSYVKGLLLSLKARGEKTEDLLTNLFKAYKSVSDQSFIKYIERKLEDYEDGYDIKPDQLIKLAGNKYQLLKEKNEWNAPSPEEEKILALQAEIQKLQKNTRNKKRPAGPNNRRSNKERRNPSNNKNKQWDPKPEWMSQRPKDENLLKPRTWKGKQWWYCSHETGGKCDPGAYRRHKPSDCRGTAGKGRNDRRDNDEEKKDESDNQQEPRKKIRLSAALAAVANEEKSSDEGSTSGYES